MTEFDDEPGSTGKNRTFYRGTALPRKTVLYLSRVTLEDAERERNALDDSERVQPIPLDAIRAARNALAQDIRIMLEYWSGDRIEKQTKQLAAIDAWLEEVER